jgi:hypothetical protein
MILLRKACRVHHGEGSSDVAALKEPSPRWFSLV